MTHANNPILKIGVAQPMVLPGQVEENIRRMEPLVAEAAGRGAKLVVFSECSVTGYDLKGVGLAAAVSLSDPRLATIDAMAQRYDVVIVAGFFERDGQTLYNSAAAFFPDGQRAVQRKHAMGGFENDVKTITPAPRARTIFDVDGFRCAILICADNGIPGIQAELAQQHCDVIIAPTAGLGDIRYVFHQSELTDPARLEE